MKSEFFRKDSDAMIIPEGGPGSASPPSRELYRLMGEENIRAMLRDFYQRLGASAIAGMFPSDLEKAAEKSALFFIGLMGGPPLYMQSYGPPRLRMRHFPFRITEANRQVWLACFNEVLENSESYQFPREHLDEFKDFLQSFSAWMVNSEDR